LYARLVPLLIAVAILLGITRFTKTSTAEFSTVELTLDLKVPFRFVAYGDARFHDPRDTDAANPPVRRALVQAVAQADPAFVCFTGDLVFNGDDANDWKVWDSETQIWRDKKIPIYPTLGNHDIRSNERVALANYFQHFPDLKNGRYYSVRAANLLVLVLDSSINEIAGPQGIWLADKFDHVPADVNFVFIVDHHPPYTSSGGSMMFDHGHSARSNEQALAKVLETRQAHASYRIVMFSGHVHNYERHEHGGVAYFVTGGAGAHAYPVERAPTDPYQSKEINYHYLLVEDNGPQIKVTMNRLQLGEGQKEIWTTPDQVQISIPTQPNTSR
jgi:3',5'-cyclic AMP phosphodiesterase CpdA